MNSGRSHFVAKSALDHVKHDDKEMTLIPEKPSKLSGKSVEKLPPVSGLNQLSVDSKETGPYDNQFQHKFAGSKLSRSNVSRGAGSLTRLSLKSASALELKQHSKRYGGKILSAATSRRMVMRESLDAKTSDGMGTARGVAARLRAQSGMGNISQRSTLIAHQGMLMAVPKVSRLPFSKAGERNYGYGYENDQSENR